MNFDALDPIAHGNRAAVTLTQPETGATVAIDAAWLARAAIHAERNPHHPLGISPELSVFLADCEPQDETEAAIIEAARIAARHFTQVRDTLIADLESIAAPNGTDAHLPSRHAPEATLTLPQTLPADDPNPPAETLAEMRHRHSVARQNGGSLIPSDTPEGAR